MKNSLSILVFCRLLSSLAARHLLAALVAALLCALAASAQTSVNTSPQAGGKPDDAQAEPQSPELSEAARLSAEVVKLFSEGKYDEALPLATRALELREKALGPEHQLVSVALNNLGVLYREKKKFDLAASHFGRALSILEKLYGREDPRLSALIQSLAVVRYRQGDLNEALTLAERNLAIKEKARGAEHEEVAEAVYLLSELYRAKNDVEKASPLFKRAIKIWTKAGRENDPKLEQARESHVCMVSNYLFSLSKNGDFKEADAARERLFGKTGDPQTDPPDDGILNGKAISKPPPNYPMSAKTDRLSGAVVVKILVNEEGKVEEASVMCGRRDVLAGAGRAAALRARFTPTLKNGQPIKVTGYITYNFILL